MSSTTENLVTLKGGIVIPEHVVLWLLNAEDRGLNFVILPDGKLRVQPARVVGAEDDRFIREHREVLKQCVEYVAAMMEVPV